MSHQFVLFSCQTAFQEVVCILQLVTVAMFQPVICYFIKGIPVIAAVIELPALDAFLDSFIMGCISPGTCACITIYWM